MFIKFPVNDDMYFNIINNSVICLKEMGNVVATVTEMRGLFNVRKLTARHFYLHPFSLF